MRAVFGLVLLVGLSLAGFAVYMVKGYFDQQQLALAMERQAAAQIVPTIQLYALKQPVAYGDRITPDMVTLIPYVATFLPEGVFRTEEELFPEGPEVLRTALRPMETNEPLIAVKVTQPGEDAGITTRLGPGMRAFAINVDVSSGVSGFLRPGDRVDVYWTGRVDQAMGGQGGEVTKLIETSVPIIAMDQSADGSISTAVVARTITVEATPQQVASLTQAQSTGSLTLSLVGSSDEVTAQAIEVNQQTLLGLAAPEAPVIQAAPAAPRVCTIKTRRGADVVEIPIPCTN